MFKPVLTLMGFIALSLVFVEKSAADSADLAHITACRAGQELTSEEQLALLAVDRTFRVFFVDGDTPKQIFIKVSTPNAFLGTAFPKETCGANVEIDFPQGGKLQGVLTFTSADPKAEHQTYEYDVKITGQPESRLSFSTQKTGVIWGFIRTTTLQGFFIGADKTHW